MKGAAYCVSNLPFSQGRLFSDIDILVPVTHIEQAEKTLKRHGWMGSQHNKYDQKYYREWMHEIPPMKHTKRLTVLDIHHSILPLTGKIKLDARKLITEATPIESNHFNEIYRLNDTDLLLHSIAHLFLDGEFKNGLRDLVDILTIIKFKEETPGFWNQLIHRASELGVARQLYYAVITCESILGAPIKNDVLNLVEPYSPKTGKQFMLALFSHVMIKRISNQNQIMNSIAGFLLFLRSHYMKMPLKLLIPHLFIKTFLTSEESAQDKRLQKIFKMNQPQ